MSARLPLAPPKLLGLRQQALQRWSAMAPRERQALGAAVLVVGLFLVWSVLIQPAWRSLRESPRQLDQLESQLQQVQRLATESRELRAAAPVSAAQAAAALKAATVRLGESAKLVLQGDRAVLTLSNVSSEGLRGWLSEARSAARTRPVEVQLQRSAQGYSGSLIVTLPGTP